MASADTLCKKLLNVKNTVVESHDIYNDQDGVTHLRIKARPNAWHKNDCPFCGRHCQGYDRPTKNPKVWRGLDWGGILVEIECSTHRVCCPKHGVVTAAVPWAYPGSSFTREFDLNVTWLAEYLSRSAMANFMRVDWQTVGSCISRSLHNLDQNVPDGWMALSASVSMRPATTRGISTSPSSLTTTPIQLSGWLTATAGRFSSSSTRL